MAKLKIAAIPDDKPVKLTIELPAAVFRDLTSYAEVLQSNGDQPIESSKLIAPMLERFMGSDREFRKMKRSLGSHIEDAGSSLVEGCTKSDQSVLSAQEDDSG